MKRAFKFLPVFLAFVFFACGARHGKPFTDVTGETVYDVRGNASAITGDVAVGLDAAMWNTIVLGSVKDGKTELRFPDLSAVEGFERRFEKIEFGSPEIKASPPDAEWFRLNLSNSIFVFTDEERDDPAGNISNNPKREVPKLKQNYTLELINPQTGTGVLFVYFTKDVTVKGSGKSGLAALDIDIKASKGWNRVYVTESQDSGTSMTTREKDASGARWIAAKTNRF